jgi:hypothetical protein
MNRCLALATICLALVACDKKDAPATADSAKPSAAADVTAAPSAVTPTPTVADVSTLPVEEDFEADAEKELTIANLNAKLDDLEKEINAP